MADGDQGNQGGQQGQQGQQQGGGQQQQGAWHAGLDAELVGKAQQKGWDISAPEKAFASAAQAFVGAEKLIGLPPDKVLRMPEASADAATLDAFWQRLGAVKDAKDIDFSTLKGADGKPIDEKLAEVIRATAVTARAPKDVVLSLTAALQKHLDDQASSAKTIRDGQIKTDREALDKSWGANKDRNLFVANQALEKLAAAAQVPLDRAKAAWDALAKVGGIGAVDAINMMYEMGVRMGEGRFVSNGSNGDVPMTRESAAAEIATLKQDSMFRDKLLKGGAEETKRWTALHKIAFGQQNAA